MKYAQIIDNKINYIECTEESFNKLKKWGLLLFKIDENDNISKTPMQNDIYLSAGGRFSFKRAEENKNILLNQGIKETEAEEGLNEP